MTVSPDSLTWSAQYQLARSDQTAKLQGDKITLPQSALEALLQAAPIVPVHGDSSQTHISGLAPFSPYSSVAGRERRLPHPLTFRLVNPQNDRVVYAGIREFSAKENEIGLSGVLRDALGLSVGSSSAMREQTPSGNGEVSGLDSINPPFITVHANQLAKGTYVRLRPLEAGYDPEDWKSLLERYLRDNFTTLTSGEVLSITSGRREKFQFLIDKLEPNGEAVCIVDTDLEVVIEALNEEQARETLSRRLAKGQRPPDTAKGSSSGGALVLGEGRAGQVVAGDYVDYEIKAWPKGAQGIYFDLEIGQDGAELDLFFSPFSARQRAKARDEEHVLGDVSSRSSKRLQLDGTNEELKDAEALFISVHAYQDSTDLDTSSPPIPFILRADVSKSETSITETVPKSNPDPDEAICNNCHQLVPRHTLALHEAFCYRNNISCPNCDQVFLKSSEIWNLHWHCPDDSASGNTIFSRKKHNSLFHPSSSFLCPNCDFQASSLPVLATHRTSTCPGKEILCKFCHLTTPQQGPDDPPFFDPAVIISGLTPHEFSDGAKTTECHLCNKLIRLRDMETHLGIHDRDRLLRPPPLICRNALCGQVLEGTDQQQLRQQLGLCPDCFAPLYASIHDDASGRLLRRRVERRLLHQLMAGCGRSWCQNVRFCRTADNKNSDGKKNPPPQSIKQLLPLITPILDTLTTSTGTGTSAPEEPLYFCVDDQSSQLRRQLAQTMADREADYRVQWWVRALWETRLSAAAAVDGRVDGDGDGDDDETRDGDGNHHRRSRKGDDRKRNDDEIITADRRWVDDARDWLRDRAPTIGEERG